MPILTVSKIRFLLDGQPFPFVGLSFFNALYNPTFNASDGDRCRWLEKFRRYGINVLRIWGQWDTRRGFIDTAPQATLYLRDGSLQEEPIQRLESLLTAAGALGMVVELALFARESWNEGIRLDPPAADAAVAALTRRLLPHRNLAFQVWNEFSDRVLDHVATIRSADPSRLVANSPGGDGVLADPRQNNALDFLTPHTTRQHAGRPWEIAPKEIEYLLARFGKPVVDDEPARCGTPKFGGPPDATFPIDHILQIQRVWQLGAGIVYHHDMFQTGYGTPAVPPSGVPDPEFSPYHRRVFEFLAMRDRYLPAA